YPVAVFYLFLKLRRSLFNLAFQCPVGFMEFLFGFFERLLFLSFRKGSPDSRCKPLLKAAFQDIILGPLREDFDGPILTYCSCNQNKRRIGTNFSGFGKRQVAVIS